MRLIVANLLLCGCSASARIASNASAIQREAKDLSSIGKEIGNDTVVTKSDAIYGLASGIHTELPGVEDQIPAWLGIVWWGFLAAALLAAAFILWQSGAFTAIRIAIGWLPRRKVQDAELAADMLDPDNPEDAREYIAARRASDPAFNAAFKKAWAARKERHDPR